jgi:HD-GYP domain-containing protein (c-di-GMP phosphodiesterase class II)
MTTDRSYRTAMSLDEAIEELEANAGTQFSPEVVEALLRVLRADPLAAGATGPRMRRSRNGQGGRRPL